HVFDRGANVFFRRVGRAALGRHGALAREGDFHHGVDAGLDIGLPRGLVAELRSAGYASAVAGEAGGLVEFFAGRVDGGFSLGSGGGRGRFGRSRSRSRSGGRRRSRRGCLLGSLGLGAFAFLGGGGGLVERTARLVGHI